MQSVRCQQHQVQLDETDADAFCLSLADDRLGIKVFCEFYNSFITGVIIKHNNCKYVFCFTIATRQPFKCFNINYIKKLSCNRLLTINAACYSRFLN